MNLNRYFCAYPTVSEGLANGGLRYLCLVLTPETRRPKASGRSFRQRPQIRARYRNKAGMEPVQTLSERLIE